MSFLSVKDGEVMTTGGTGEADLEAEADEGLGPLGCQPGGQSGLQRADAIVGQVEVGDFAWEDLQRTASSSRSRFSSEEE